LDDSINDASLSNKLQQRCEIWLKENLCADAQQGQAWVRRCADALAYSARQIAEQCVQSGDSPDVLHKRLWRAWSFFEELDTTLHSGLDDDGGLFRSEVDKLWRRVNFVTLVRTTKPPQRVEFAQHARIAESIDGYLNNSFLQNSYLDWLLLDAMTVQKALLIYEALMESKHGIGYALFGAVPWKLTLWKLIAGPCSFLLGWVVPGIVCYFVAQWSLWMGLGMAVVYYAISVFLLLRWLQFRLLSVFGGGPTQFARLRRKFEEIVDLLYPLLAGPVLHVATIRSVFEQTLDRNVIWDQRIFYILDHAAQRNSQVWSNRIRKFEPPDLAPESGPCH